MLLEKAEKSGVITIAYDEVYPIEYFHEPLEEYYKKFYSDFAEMLRVAIDEYNVVKELCENFDRQYISEAIKFGGKYMLITSLAYRQVLAAHKLVEDKKGNLIYLSKECDSNGCIGTLDVTYPSIPLFLKYNPELVLGMLRPIIHYANTTEWEYEFAPHDVGRYPLANGQVYGNNELKYQMPIEECGNMLLCVAAVAKATGNIEFAIENQEILKKWAEYLIQKGYNPEDQLCTDDFAGHLAQNCNLSLKSILGIAAYGKLFGEDSYIAIAKKMADKWCEEAVSIDSTHTKLAFDQNDTWSLKYNIVWDKLLDIGLFEEKIFANEVAWYKQKMNHYGVPLDSRKDYTKLDWLFWTTVMTSDKEYFTGVVDAVFDMICDTEEYL